MAAEAPSEDAVAVLPTAGRRRSAVMDWIIHHDDSWLFIGCYIGLAVVLSIVISLFWLVVVVGVHFAFEWVRQRTVARNIGGVLARALWELKLDIALVLFALALTAYMNVILGVAGLGGAARLGIQAGARSAGWSRVLRGILISLDDAAQVARVAVTREAGSDDEPASPAAATVAPWRRWTLGDHIGIWLGVICLALIVIAPVLTDHDVASLLSALAADLHPFPPDTE